MGHKLTEPEQYLAFLLIRDIQSNPKQRFEIIPSKEVNDLLQAADPDMSSKTILLPYRADMQLHPLYRGILS